MEYSDRYILSKTKSLSDKSKCNKDLYHNDIDSISSKLLNIKITQHLSSAIGLEVFSRLILLISNPFFLISSTKVGIK